MISGNTGQNVFLSGAGTNANVVVGNFIGLNATATAGLPSAGSQAGIWIRGGAQGNTIGATSGGRNFICGNNGAGVVVSDAGTDANIVVGNSIGVTPGGTTVANAQEGIVLFGGPQGSIIGGSTAGAANLISGNAAFGIGIYDTATTATRISGNSIFGNMGIGIDLFGGTQNGFRVTANDANDADTGPNNLQNFPVLTSAVLGTGTTIAGTLNSTASAITYRVEFFENTSGDPSGNGEGQNFVGAINVTTNASGAASFNTTLPAIVPADHVVTATATDPAGIRLSFPKTEW